MTEPAHPRELLAAYLDDELPLEERSSVDRHLALCASCRKQLASLTALSRAVAEEPVPEVPAGLAARIGRAIDEASVVPMPKRRGYAIPATIAATIAALGLLVVVQWRENAPPQREAPAELSKSVGAPTPAPPAAPPAEYKQDLPIFDRADQKAKEPFQPPASVEAEDVKKEADERQRADTRGGFAPVPESVPAPPPAPAAGSKVEGYVGGVAAAPQPTVSHDEESRRERDANKLSALSEAPAAGRFSQDAVPDVCGERWIDTSILGVWFVEDRDRSTADLAALSRRLGGRVEPVEPYTDQLALVVPRKRLPEMIGSLRGLGVAGLEGPFAPEDGFACVRQRLQIVSGRSR